MNAYDIGVMCGIALGAVIAIVVNRVLRKSGRMINGYDERQLAEQGRAAKWGMYALVIMIMCYGLIGSYLTRVTPLLACSCIGIIGISVYAGVCIAREAYFPFNGSLKVIRITLAIGIVNVIIAVIAFITGGVYDEDGMMRMQMINLVAGVDCIVVPLLGYFKAKSDAARLSDDEEPEE